MGPKGSRKPSATALAASIPSEEDPIDINDENTDKITRTYLEKALKQQAQIIQDGFNQTISTLQSRIDNLTTVANNANKRSELLQAKVTDLETKNKSLLDRLTRAETNIHKIEERVEERTNRQLRKTLVFKGIPEKASPAAAGDDQNQPSSPNAQQQSKETTWAETTTELAKSIAKACSINFEQASGMIERAHRSAPNPRYKGRPGPRPIFAAFYRWPDAESVVDGFRAKNIANKNYAGSADYKFGPLTTQRRNLAFQERRKLKEAGTIMSAYVAYPARLMTKSRREGAKYTLHKDFSREPVEFGKRD